MHRYFVTGTDTDIGKTRVTATIARALRDRGREPTIVKVVQTGLAFDETGDAEYAGRLSDSPSVELARFSSASDPWSAAIADGVPALRAQALASAISKLSMPIVVQGSGGLAVPLNEGETLGVVAQLAELRIVLGVGLRLGCINHALLTLAYCDQLGLAVAGAVFIDRWGTTTEAYRNDVWRALRERVPILGLLPFSPDAKRSVTEGSQLFSNMIAFDDELHFDADAGA